jgi:UDP-glucose 4-epimerase
MKKNILITGGAGYIGAHTVQYLQQIDKNKQYNISIIDNIENGYLHNIPAEVSFHKIDLRDFDRLNSAVADIKPSTIIHFAGYAYVGESMKIPIEYFNNNVLGGINILKAISLLPTRCNLVFSSSCSVYGNSENRVINEYTIPSPQNPYAESKLIFEKMMHWMSLTGGVKYVSLRYFNAAGAVYPLKEEHNPETHLIPNAIKAAINSHKTLEIFGDDYPTIDGTCVRDFVHVSDLAKAHYLAFKYLDNGGNSEIINLGTGIGTSVIEIINLVEDEVGSRVNKDFKPRRAGDVASLIADPRKAKEIINWTAMKTIKEIIADAVKSENIAKK